MKYICKVETKDGYTHVIETNELHEIMEYQKAVHEGVSHRILSYSGVGFNCETAKVNTTLPRTLGTIVLACELAKFILEHEASK